jgi:hypothetical protein
MDKVYDSLGEEPLSLLFRLQLGVHLLFCRRCAEEVKKLKAVQEYLQTGFFPDSPHFEDSIMEQIYAEESALANPDWDTAPGVSFRSWVITGFIVLISLSTVFFSMDFVKVAASEGSSFLLPVGLTVGGILTSYGAIFIGSHLKKFSQWFGLH